MAGKFTLLPDEEAKIRREAEEKGEDPDAAVEAARVETVRATGRLREAQSQKAVEGLEEELNK